MLLVPAWLWAVGETRCAAVGRGRRQGVDLSATFELLRFGGVMVFAPS